MRVFGINAVFDDSAAALVVDGRTVAAAIAWGERVTTHPLASPTSWRSGLKVQAGNADNAWLRAKYDPAFADRNPAGRGPAVT